MSGLKRVPLVKALSLAANSKHVGGCAVALGMFVVHAGDFRKGKDHQYVRGKLLMKKPKGFFREKVKLDELKQVEVASEESVKRLGGTIGWGIAGAVLLGPVGLLAGLLAGGRGKDVTFICELKDGRKFLATAPSKVFVELQASTFNFQKSIG